MRPTKYLDKWDRRDRALAEGLLELESSIGPHGVPMRDALDPDNDGAFTVDEEFDFAQQAIDQFRADEQSGKRKVPPGRFLVVRNTRTNPKSRYERMRPTAEAEGDQAN